MTRTSTDRGRFTQLIAVMVLLIVADGIISQYLVLNGLGQESNPFLKVLVGADVFLAVKVAGGLLAGLILFHLYRSRPAVAFRSTIVFVIFYVAILFWNLGVLFFSRAAII